MKKDNITDNNFDGMDSSVFYTSIIPTMVDNSKISSSDLSMETTFSDETDTSELYEYIQKHEARYLPHIDELKSGIVRIKSSEIANQIYTDLYAEFSSKIDSVEIFAVIIDYFGFGEKDYFDKLLLDSRMTLLTDLSKRIDIGDSVI